jgi:hypothetical protein
MFAIRVAALGLIVCVFVIAGVLAAVGAPIPLAIFIAFLLVGLAAMLVERRLGRDAPVLGITFLSIGGLVGIAAMVQAVPQVNGWIIGLGTLAVEIGILIGLVKLYRRRIRHGERLQRHGLRPGTPEREERPAADRLPGPPADGHALPEFILRQRPRCAERPAEQPGAQPVHAGPGAAHR